MAKAVGRGDRFLLTVLGLGSAQVSVSPSVATTIAMGASGSSSMAASRLASSRMLSPVGVSSMPPFLVEESVHMVDHRVPDVSIRRTCCLTGRTRSIT